ncbi:hypothetical protein PIB30_002358 [Stylosanthes scabra]|uniref:Uncharacterized protein n=1 Tax=Stylosanthes scabra TaxID=79078 RepID=A0ABU6V1C8_9FABA|nr:hypothetical protein [Stylosanthes scabra]
MAFVISRGESAFSENEKSSLEEHLEDKDSAITGKISCELQLKSSLSPKASSQSLSKQAVLQRIRQRKLLNKIKSTVEGFSSSLEGNTATAMEQKWLQQEDTFSAP